MLAPRSLLSLLVLICLAVGLGLSLASPGVLLIDDGIYLAQTHSLANGQGLAYDNGFGSHGSRELWIHGTNGPWMTPVGDTLMPQYPPGMAALAAPFYPRLGAAAALVPNLAAGALLLWLTAWVGREVSGHRSVALLAAMMLLFASPLPDSMAAIWPHTSSAVLILGAFLLSWRSTGAATRRQGLVLAAGAGVLVGLALCFRLDALFAAPAMMLVLLLRSGPSLLRPCALGIGLLPGLGLMSAVNLWRYDNPWPFYYGGQAASSDGAFYLTFVPVIMTLALVAAGGTWLRASNKTWRVAAVGLALVALLGLGHAGIRASLSVVPGGLYETLVDIRTLTPFGLEAGAPRTETGAVAWFGILKKAWLQSLPWLPLALVPLIHRSSRGPALTLLALPLALAMVFGPTRWHGGLCASMRYLLPALPLATIAAAWGARQLIAGLDRRAWGALVAGAVGAWSVYGVACWPALPAGRAEALLLTLPLQLAAALTALVLLASALHGRRVLSTAALAVAGVCLGWAGATSWGYDLRQIQGLRSYNHQVSSALADVLEPDALVFYVMPDPLLGLVERGDVWLANPLHDDFADFHALARAHDQADDPVYLVTPADFIAYADGEGQLLPFQVEPVTRVDRYVVARLRWQEQAR